MLNIVTYIKDLDAPITGAVGNSCLGIARNIFATSGPCRIVAGVEENAGTYKKRLRIVREMVKIIFALLKNEDLIFIYPTVPLYPGTSMPKYRLAKIYYAVLRAIKGKSRIFTYIIDLPKEQEESFGTRRIKIAKEKLLEFEDIIFSLSDKVISVSSGFKALLFERSDNYGNKTEILPVAIEPQEKKARENGNIKIFYSGELTREYEKNMIRSISKILTENQELVICGRGGDWIDNEKLAHIVYKGYVDKKMHDEIAADCDFAVIFYPNTGYYKYVVPAKLCTYIGLLLPVLAIKTDSISEIFKDNKIGECVAETEFTEVLEKWCKNKAFFSYDMEKESQRFYMDTIEKLKSILEK